MKSDLTCPVEVVRVHVRREEKEIVEEPRKQLVDGKVVIEEGEPRKRIEEQIICDIEFQNLSEKETASIQMNIICFDADNQRLGGRLVRSMAVAEPKGYFRWPLRHMLRMGRPTSAISFTSARRSS